ncbi:amidase [Bordetella sp. BOR01]|uniref:amidase n=1 Tax=Bordetella sp. BOR01 TaxID=2854779 RepID=UPI001C470D15|nr:amidase [Bordetella sp. BOR01]MBV7482790.1 amidase [Bordetella sp. BOR01]
MDIEEYLRHDGLSLAAQLRQGTTEPRALMQCAIELARQRAEPLNALCYPDYDAALERAAACKPTGVFGGLPFLLKDSGLACDRLPSSIGLALYKDTHFSGNATLVDRFDAAGLVPFARSTVPALCMAPTTEATVNGGPTRNPWAPDRSAGGSSGGAAVAVATGVVPLAHGSDGGGSIRIPASCCGVFGLKPSRGLVPLGPARGEAWGGMAGDGVLSRSVRDTAAALDAIAGMEPGAPYAAPTAPGGGYLAALAQPFERPLRIGVWQQAWDGIEVDPACTAALAHAETLCRQLGHATAPMPAPALDYAAFVRAHIGILCTHIALGVDARLAGLQRGLRDDDLEPAILDGYRRARQIGATDYAGMIQTLHAIGRSMAAAMSGYDLVLSPTLTRPPVALGEMSMAGDFVPFRQKVARYTTFLAVINASGQPAASLPLYTDAQGLPIGVQLIGALGRDDLVLRLAAELERAAPWASRFPPIKRQAPR